MQVYIGHFLLERRGGNANTLAVKQNELKVAVNDVARTPKKLRISKGDYRIKQ